MVLKGGDNMKDKIANRPDQDSNGDIVLEDKMIVDNPSHDLDVENVYNDNGKLVIQDITTLKNQIRRNVLEIQESVAVATTSHEMAGNVASETNKKAMNDAIDLALANINNLCAAILSDLK